ncbi:unnamed protein product [Adineta ricciae]|uniref:Uncharacterized protein n=1 Tax=Adineta ricciae TaxID=249248 RepID=A0A815RV28_ADIRI|nr:unnamed protein product [Adineta ricciae]
MPNKREADTAAKLRQSCDKQIKARQLTSPTYTSTNESQGMAKSQTTRENQLKFTISLLIVDGVRLNKLELNDMITKYLSDASTTRRLLIPCTLKSLSTTDVCGSCPIEHVPTK